VAVAAPSAAFGCRPDAGGPALKGRHRAVRLLDVVLFFEILLVAAVLVITWFALYAVYRLVTDES
jgi:hypothetical protein